MTDKQRAAQRYLEAVGQVYGADYRARTVVAFGGGHYVLIKHPDDEKGMVVPVGHLDIMTEQLLAGK